jgi:catechol 2,3-dioxygenase-like lactoylglutathione lyase family enzyme
MADKHRTGRRLDPVAIAPHRTWAIAAVGGILGGMKVKRIVTNIAAADVSKARQFYVDVLGLSVAMDHGWIITFCSSELMAPQISVANEGGSDTPVPDISVEVDDLQEALRRVHAAGIFVEYGPTQEPWGVERFYVRDPFGRLVNILAHS